MLDSGLTIINYKCFMYSMRTIALRNTLQTLFTKLIISSDFTSILHVFLAGCVCYLTYIDELTYLLATICLS